MIFTNGGHIFINIRFAMRYQLSVTQYRMTLFTISCNKVVLIGASARFLIYFTVCKIALGSLHHCTCPAANAVGLPWAWNNDYVFKGGKGTNPLRWRGGCPKRYFII